jgi:glycopeptide antibiotics resistance protein
LTVPFGFGAGLIFRMPAKRIPWLAAAAGLSLETAQLAISLLIGAVYRGIDINDVMLNALGVLIGYSVFRVFAWLYKAVKFGKP